MTAGETENGIRRSQRRNSIKKELVRKSIHLCSALVPTFLNIAYWQTVACLATALAVYTVSELLRLRGVQVPLVAGITEIAARKRDENKFVLGPVTLVLGIIATALVWKPDAARIGIYALAFGDGLASLAGKLFGKKPLPFAHGKTAAGSLTCFAAVFCASLAVCKNAPVSLVLAVVAMLVEILPLKDFDNLVIPVLIGGLAQVLLVGN